MKGPCCTNYLYTTKYSISTWICFGVHHLSDPISFTFCPLGVTLSRREDGRSKNIHYKRNSCNKKKKRRISNRFINGLKWNKWRCYLKIITLCTLGFLDILNDEFWIIIFFHSKWITLWKRTLQILTDRGFQRESAKFLCHEPTAVRSRAHVP